MERSAEQILDLTVVSKIHMKNIHYPLLSWKYKLKCQWNINCKNGMYQNGQKQWLWVNMWSKENLHSLSSFYMKDIVLKFKIQGLFLHFIYLNSDLQSLNYFERIRVVPVHNWLWPKILIIIIIMFMHKMFSPPIQLPHEAISFQFNFILL